MVATISLLPNGEQSFVSENGIPYALGKVYMYIPNTLTFKNTWQDMDRFALNTNPIDLDAAGRCVIWGEGIYRQILKDRLGNLIWDKLTVSYTSAADVENIINDILASIQSVYDLPVYIQGKPTDGETFPIFNFVRSEKLPAGLTDSVFTISTLPTASMVFTLYKNGSSIGTITFATSGAATVVFVADVTFNAGDQFAMTAPSPQDTTGAYVAMTFALTVL